MNLEDPFFSDAVLDIKVFGTIKKKKNDINNCLSKTEGYIKIQTEYRSNTHTHYIYR